MKINKLLFLRKLFSKFWSKEFLRYFVVGSSSVLLDIGTLYCLKDFFGLSPVLSIVINQLIIYVYVFLLNKFWVFSIRSATLKQMIRYCILALINYIIAIIWMWFFHNILGINYLLVRLGNIALSTIWNFLIYRFFVYQVNSTAN